MNGAITVKSGSADLGVSLLEVLIAACILTCLALPLLYSISTGSILTVKINNLSKASRMAQQIVEECRHTPFAVYEAFLKEGKDIENKDGREILLPETQWEKFFPKTRVSVQEFSSEVARLPKDFGLNPSIKVYRGSSGQILEIWVDVEINWVDRGSKSSMGEEGHPRRIARAGGVMYNSEAVY